MTSAVDEPPGPNSLGQAEKPQQPRIFLVVVDDTPEFEGALHYACLRAKRTKGHVALLYAIEPVEFQHWAGVGALMAQEHRETAEQVMMKMAGKAAQWAESVPVLHIREGRRSEALFSLLEEDPDISILVLGADTGTKGPGPLVAEVSRRLGSLKVPVTVVPGHLGESSLYAIT